MRRLEEEARERVLLYDGSKGTLLQGMGLPLGTSSETWNVDQPEKVRSVYTSYLEAGCRVIQTNTFPGNRPSLEKYGRAAQTEAINREGVRLAREAAEGRDVWVVASAGPSGDLLAPAGELTFDRAYEIFAEQARALEAGGADAVNFETFADLGELRAAILAAREQTSLTVIASATFEPGGRTMSGNPADVVAMVCASLGAHMVGANCSTGPEEMVPVIRAIAAAASVPVSAKPNAGMPETSGGRIVYKETPEHFASFACPFVEAGASLIGGCCGTTPEHLRSVGEQIAGCGTPSARPAPAAGICSARRALSGPLEERRLGVVSSPADTDDLVDRASDLEGDGAELLLVENIGVGIDAVELSEALSLMVRIPVVLDRVPAETLAPLLRRYVGVAGVLDREGEALGGLWVDPAQLERCPRVR